MALQAGEMTAEIHFLTALQNAPNNIDVLLWGWVGCCCSRLVCCVGVFWVGGGLELGSGLPISKLALVKQGDRHLEDVRVVGISELDGASPLISLGLVLGMRALMGPILKLEHPTPFVGWQGCCCPFDWLAKSFNFGRPGQPIKKPAK